MVSLFRGLDTGRKNSVEVPKSQITCQIHTGDTSRCMPDPHRRHATVYAGASHPALPRARAIPGPRGFSQHIRTPDSCLTVQGGCT